MRIGIVGPTKISAFCNRIGKSKKRYFSVVRKIAEFLTKHELVIVPDKGSLAEFVAQAYHTSGGKKVMGVVPKKDKEFGISWLNLKICDKIIDCSTWRNSPEVFDEVSDVLLVFGLGAGAMIEIGYTKWWERPVIILKEFISSKLPKEIERELNIHYVSAKGLSKKLKQL